MKILVIDDNTDITNLMQKVLTSKGLEVTTCNNGKDGLELIRKNNSDAILLDIAMPNFSGKDIVDSLSKENTIGNHNIILFTASSITDDEIDLLIKKGVKGCLRKPVRIEELLELVNKFKK